MTQLLLVTIFIAAGLSLVSYVYCWQDVKHGRPHIISLRQITSIMDRNRLNELFGPPEPGYFYPLARGQLQALVRSRRWFFYRECAADTVCLLGAWMMTGSSDWGMVYWFIMLAGVCQAINFAYSIWLINKWRHQLREEIENSID